MPKKHDLPDMIYVKKETEDGDSYFVADTNIKTMVDMGEKALVGEYRLVNVMQVEGTVATTKVVGRAR